MSEAESRESFPALIDEVEESAGDPTYIGSSGFRERLERYVQSRFASGPPTLKWIPPGQRANWNGGTSQIELETPQSNNNVSDKEIARFAATLALHESLHHEFSGKVPALYQQGWPPPHREREFATFVLNQLEDARIARLAVRNEAELSPFLETFHRTANQQQIEGQNFFPANTRQRAVLQAILAYAHGLPVNDLSADSLAQEAFEKSCQHLDAALSGDIEQCARASERIARVLFDPALN